MTIGKKPIAVAVFFVCGVFLLIAGPGWGTHDQRARSLREFLTVVAPRLQFGARRRVRQRGPSLRTRSRHRT